MNRDTYSPWALNVIVSPHDVFIGRIADKVVESLATQRGS